MWRSIGVVFASLGTTMLVVVLGTAAATAVLAGAGGELTTSYLAANLLISAAAAVAGGWLAVTLAARRPLIHGLAVAATLGVLSIPAILSPPSGQPAWYPVTLLALAMTGAAAGAVVAAARPRKASAGGVAGAGVRT